MSKQPRPGKDQSQREDLQHQPGNAGKVGSQHKDLNRKGEQPRPGTRPDGGQR